MNKLASKEAVNADFEKYGVYSKYINTESDESKIGISTQKVTFFFIKAVIVGWDILAVKNSFDLCKKLPSNIFEDKKSLIIIFCFLVIVGLNFLIWLITDGMKSDLSKMEPWERE